MKAFITVAALASLVAVPSVAFAAKARHHVPAQERTVMLARPTAVFAGNQYMGADPDANIRLELTRDASLIDGSP